MVKENMKKVWMLAAILPIIFYIVLCINVCAAPADSAPREFLQSDGTIIKTYLYGDEHFNWTEEENGYIISYSSQDGNWYYATIVDSHIVPGEEIVGEKETKFQRNRNRIKREDIQFLFEENTNSISQYTSDYERQINDTDLIEYRQNNLPKTNQELLLVLVEFENISFQTDYQADLGEYWRNQYFLGDKSVAGYYKDMSNGLDIFKESSTQDVVIDSPDYDVKYEGNDTRINDIPWVKNGVNVSIYNECDGVIKVRFHMAHPIESADDRDKYYDTAIATLALKAIKENTNYNFNNYGINKYVSIVVAGSEASTGYTAQGQVWAHAEFFDGSIVGVTGKRMYALHGELSGENTKLPIGTACHELGHILGLPDLYNTKWKRAGINFYSLMAYGHQGALNGESKGTTPVALDAWCKSVLGYVNPIEYEEFNFANVHVNCAAPIGDGERSLYNAISIRKTEERNSKQYFLFENRQNAGWDAGMQVFLGENFVGGISIILVDDNIVQPCMEKRILYERNEEYEETSETAWNIINASDKHRGVNIIGAKQDELTILMDNYFYSADNSERHSLNRESVPNSNFYDYILPNAGRILETDIVIEIIDGAKEDMQVELGIDDNIAAELRDEDNTFLHIIQEILGKSDNDEIRKSEVSKIEKLDLVNKDIRDVKGLKYFWGLKEFIGYFNEFITLDFSYNKNLEVLDCSYNAYLTSINISNNTKLTDLSCQYAKLTSLDITNNVNLINLYCFENDLGTLDISNNILLERLNCWENGLSTLDVSNNKNLIEIDCWGNYLTTLNISENKNLTYLDCCYNYMNSIDDVIGLQEKNLTLDDTFYFYPQDTPNTEQQNNRIEYRRTDENTILAELKFEGTDSPKAEDIYLLVIYEQDDKVKAVDVPELKGMTATFKIYAPSKNYDMKMCVWNKNMQPLMEMRKIT